MRTVPLKDLVLEYPGWLNPRLFTGMSDGEIEDLAATIKTEKDKGDEDGILDPPKVVRVKTPEGAVIDLVIDGQRRCLAGHRVLAKNTPIEVVDLEDKPITPSPAKFTELMLKALKVGTHRRELSSYELSEVAQRLRDSEPPAQLADIAEAIDKSESWVSRFLKARLHATPKLMASWRNGDITDEQFKDLAVEKNPEKQAENTATAVETRKAGDKAGARATTKEIAETAKQKKARIKKEKLEAKAAAKAEKDRAKTEAKAKKLEAKAAKKAAKGGAVKNGVTPAVSGEQAEMEWSPPPVTDKPKKPAAPSRVALEEMIALADDRPPTHEYVKGIITGVRLSTGAIEIHELGKPWAAWISRVGGSAAPKKGSYAEVRARKKESKKLHTKLARARKAKAPKAKPTKKPTKKPKAKAKARKR